MAEDWPKIKARRTTRSRRGWKSSSARSSSRRRAEPEIYHAVGQPDYIAIARADAGRQHSRSCGNTVRRLKRFTWELPAGLVDAGEAAAACCERELLEETGYPARAVHALGVYAPCTARLSNRVHSFFVETGATRRKPWPSRH